MSCCSTSLSPISLSLSPSQGRTDTEDCYILTLHTDSVYVDEATGDDQTGDGTQSKPFKTVLGSFIARDSDSINVQVKTTPKEGEGAAVYQDMTASAKKKASKLFAQHKNKLAKQEELRTREEAEGEAKRLAEAKKLEEAKAIVLEEPSTSAKKIKIRQAVEERGKRVRVFGWVHRLRQQGGMTFVILRDGTGYLQCVLTGRLVSFFRFSRASLFSIRLTSCTFSRIDSHKLTTLSLSPSNRLFKSLEKLTNFLKERLLLTTTSSRLTGSRL